jgi:synaptobrevin homolog YKT6
MKVYSIIIFNKEDKNLFLQKETYDVSNVPFFYRNETKESLRFLSKTVAERVTNQKLCVTEKDYNVYIVNRNNISVVAITDKDYHTRVAFSLADLIALSANNANIEKLIVTYQNPDEADKILKIQKNIDQTKVTMVDAIDKVLAREERIDDLVAKSSDLSDGSKAFYKDAKKMNSWCSGCNIQ